MARTTGDIKARVSKGAVFDSLRGSVMKIAEINNKSAAFAGNGYWNDPDMLAVGNQGLTTEEQKVHFALWCIMSSPLILGNDPRNMTAEEKDIITNELAIAINQDPTEQGKLIKADGTAEVWAKKLKDGKFAVLFLNRDNENNKTVNFSLSDITKPGVFYVQDVYSGDDLGSFSNSFSKKLAPHSGLFIVVKAK